MNVAAGTLIARLRTGIALARRTVSRALIMALVAAPGPAHGASIDETRAAAVMAAYLRHIAALTTWPGTPGAQSGRPIQIGVVGEDPNGVMAPIRARMNSAEQLMAQGRPLRVLELTGHAGRDTAKALEPYELLFFSAGSWSEWEKVRPTVSSMPIVTVSEMTGFARDGGMIEYFIDLTSGRVRLIVNLAAMRQAGITLSARLLALESVIVLGERDAA
jgi:hypothetical protein